MSTQSQTPATQLAKIAILRTLGCSLVILAVRTIAPDLPFWSTVGVVAALMVASDLSAMARDVEERRA